MTVTRTDDAGVTYSELRSMLGEGFHTAFRKAIDGPGAMPIHHLISDMDDEDWGRVISFVAGPLWDLLKERGGITGDKREFYG